MEEPMTPPESAIWQTKPGNRSFLWFLAALLLICAGCSTVSNIGKDIQKKTEKALHSIDPISEAVQKKIGIIRFENKTLFTKNKLETNFTRRLGEEIKQNCPSVIVVTPKDKDFPDMLTALPRDPSGRIDNMALANIAKKLGLNAIVTGSLHDISENAEEKGILWFKDVHNFINTKLIVEVFDSQSAAKLIDNVYVHELEVNELEYDMIRAKKAQGLPELDIALENIAAEVGEEICEEIAKQPWRAYIIGVNAKEATLSSGSQVGLKPNDRFDIYDGGKILEGAGGQRFHTPGQKCGELKITTVTPQTAQALLTQGEMKQGDYIKFK